MEDIVHNVLQVNGVITIKIKKFFIVVNVKLDGGVMGLLDGDAPKVLRVKVENV